MSVERLKLGLSCFGDPWQAGNRLFVPSSSAGSAMLDLRSHPPAEQRLPVQLRDAVPHPESGWLLAGRRDGPGPFVAWWSPDETLADLALEAEGSPCSQLAVLGREVFGLPRSITHDDQPVPLLRLAGGPPGPVEEIPPSRGYAATTGSRFHTLGSVRLGDGAEVLFWDGQGWERDARAGFVRSFELDAESVLRTDLVPAGADGFYYLHQRRVFLARRGRPPEPVLPWAENVMRIAPGPADALLLDFGRNPRSLVLALAFPVDGSFIPLKRKDLDSPHVNEIFHGFFWSGATGRLLTVGWHLVALDAADILSRKRSRPKR